MKKSIPSVLVILFILLLPRPWDTPAQAKKAFLSDIVVTNTRDDLLVYFTVNDCFTVEMNSAIESGLNTTFTFFIRLYEKRELWWDRKVKDIEISHSVKYDNLKKIYEMILSEEGDNVIVVKSFEEVKKLMAEVVAMKVVPLERLKKGGRYQLRLMAEMDKIELPFYLHYVFFFLSLWDFETDWYSVDFRY